MGRALRRTLAAAGVTAVVATGGGVAVAGSSPTLSTAGPVSVTGTEASGVFTVADRTVRQIRYADQGTLRYTFTLSNEGRLPVTVAGLEPDQIDPRLFDLVGLTTATLSPGGSGDFTLTLDMNGCESLSSRSGSFVSEVVVRTRQAGMFDDTVTIALPEEIHTGSPREAFCPESTATSRPQG
ncbi:MAG: hypothetical protein WKF50_07900 [Nocardioides sp.]